MAADPAPIAVRRMKYVKQSGGRLDRTEQGRYARASQDGM